MARGLAEVMAGCRRGGGRCTGGNGCVGGGRGGDYVNGGGWGREKGRYRMYRWRWAAVVRGPKLKLEVTAC